MSEVVENVSEQNSAQSKEAAAQPTEDVTTNNVEAVPEAVESDADVGSKETAEKSSTSPKVDNKKTPVKRTPSKRISYIERARQESEELVKNMGGSLEIEGGRKTRSSTRGTPTRSAAASTPPPSKKARSSPASGASTPTRPRGRGRKIDVADDAAEEEENKPTPSKKKTPVKGKKAAAKDVAEDEEVEENEAEKKSEEKEDKVDSSESSVVASSEETKDKVVEKPEIDEADAAALEPVAEETQSQVAGDLLATEKKVTKESENANAPVEVSDSYKSDSPMETEEVKLVTEKNEAKGVDTTAKTSAVEALQLEKEATPEPMEVDSSSKSNDAFEKMDDDVVEIVQEPTKKAEVTSANAIKLNNLQKVGENVQEKSVAAPADILPNNSIAKATTAAAIDIVDANENKTEETPPAAHDLNKAENDLCEPKIATSPQISAANDNNSSITTPQIFN